MPSHYAIGLDFGTNSVRALVVDVRDGRALSSFTWPYTYGNAGRGIVQGPGLANLDTSLQRSFKTSETTSLQFRFEGFNITNHTNFWPEGNLGFGVANFGVIQRALASRNLQFGLKFYY